ncbi:MAG: excinuclease ABC subunit UvrC [Patescibacteria group bacterium]
MKKPDLSAVSSHPGVYLMKDESGEVLYVGKAKNLKKRVTSYWSNYPRQATKVKVLLDRVVKVDTIAVKTEVEALVLENELIKEHRPQFNVLLRDDKNYLYIRITMQDEFPRILLARKIAKDGAKYFGPFTESKTVYSVLRLVKKIFPICSSNSQMTAEKTKKGNLRACLNYHIGVCPGVCMGKVSSEEYKQTMRQVVKFIGGQYDEVLKELKVEMQEASSGKKYEIAARIRDNIQAIEKLQIQQSVVLSDIKTNADVIGVARQLNKVVVALLSIRFGKLLSKQTFVMDSSYEVTDSEVVSAFVRDYYAQVGELPREVYVSEKLEDQEVLSSWLTDQAGKRVEVLNPSRGSKRDLVEIAIQNAKLRLGDLAVKLGLAKRGYEDGVEQLKEILKLEKLHRIEAYDISNTQGTDSVGSMVVFEGKEMNKDQYRRFKIKTVEGPDDYASLAEVLKRRFARMDDDGQFARKPDLILIDGGKGQVNTVAKALGDIGIQIIGVAKGDHSAPKAKDDLVIPGMSEVMVLPNNAPAKYLLQTIRDEAHRFALGLHTSLARKRVSESQIEKVKGIGPATRKKLIKQFGSMAGVKRAKVEEIAEVVGMQKAKILKDQL